MSAINTFSRTAFLFLILLAWAPGPLRAIPIIGTTGTTLYKFDTATPGTVTTLTITGMVVGEKLVGIDFRPSNGGLYGVGQSGRLYAIDRNTGGATNISGPPSFALSGGTFGTEIGAVDDQLRIISNTNQNMRIDPDTGDPSSNDTALTYNGNPSNVAGLAYTNGYPGAFFSTAYAIGTVDGQLLRIGSVNGMSGGPETGVVTKVGSLGLGTGFNQTLGFDIGPNGIAYAAINIGAQLRFYTINLSTGAATNVGVIGSTNSTTTFTGLTAQTGPMTFFNTNTILIPQPFQPDAFVKKASPYPSSITVSGLTGVVTKLVIFLNDFRHKDPSEVDMLLVAPDTSRKMVFMSDVAEGGFSTCGNNCNNEDQIGSTGDFLYIFDAADKFMPEKDPLTFLYNVEFYKPTNYTGFDGFLSPAPASPYALPFPSGGATLASTFNGTAPNGTWSLYIEDDNSSPPSGVQDDTGRLQSGWSIEVTAAPTPTPPPGNLANISTRLRVETGDNVLIGGFIITGTEPKRVLLRAIGPSLPLADKLADPKLELYSGANLLASNDNWKDAANKQETIDTTIPPSNDLESAIVKILNPGSYTAVVSGVNGATGVGVVEAYDLTRSINARFANIATRGLVQTGDNVLIAGTIVSGAAGQTVLVRAIGPSLPLSGTLANPTLELRNANGVAFAANDNWRSDQEDQIIATTIPPPNDFESAIIATLPPASYTAIVKGAGGSTGIAVVEVYAIN